MSEQSVKLNMLILLEFLLLSYGAGNVHCATVHGNSADMLSLLDFKTATRDPTDALRSWNRSINYCNWTGVICSPGNPGRVAALELGGESLAGQITPSLGNLTFLQILILSSNGFTGQLPPLSQLHDLWLLDIHSNSLQGIIPDSLTNCSNLESVDLSRNMLEGPIPAKISNATQLTTLDLANNSFVGEIPSFGKLLNLTKLNLEYNKLESRNSQRWESLYGLTNCRSLEYLALNNNQLQGAIPNLIGNFSTKLAYLRLSGNNLSGIVPPSLQNLSGLINLNLSINSFNGTIDGWVGSLKKLQSLDLHGNSFVGSIPPSFGNLTMLIRLSLAKNEFEGPIPDSLTNCSYLLDLDLSRNMLEGPIPAKIGSFYNLIALDLSKNSLTGVIPPTISNITHLQKLVLQENELVGSIP